MSRIDVTIQTRDGQCPAALFTPAGKTGSWPGVIFFMDGLGVRPTMWEMGQRLADLGYTVLLPDLYYRGGSYEPMVPAQVFADPKAKEVLMQRIGSLDRERKIADAGAFIDFLLKRPEVTGQRLGTTGYCMGGNVALTVAGAYPDRFAATGSFHAGGLATEQPDSPHRFLKGMTGRVYVGGADQDAHFTSEQMAALEKALADAGVNHRVEIYAGAMHGYAVPDHPAFNAQAAERHWQALSALFSETLAR
ncbi:dienelactone hydrolase family protein [Dyella psychrodurans]|uniref:Dienelactone hydrolase family protein n=1 Tax=Dyella psychrodurans TaxID=1927960 RepID=A0A370X0U6_9GAMM|nr:dienelactone hydrolase family protein [Dyella psychrodurans]RDS82028.1 dienelactone hydrolase family protein [Dyella psychrodurans]